MTGPKMHRYASPRIEEKIRAVLKTVQEETGVPMRDIMGRSQEQSVARARHMAVYLCQKHNLGTLSSIADRFGFRDHTGAYYSSKAVDRLRRSRRRQHEEFQRQLSVCQEFLKERFN